MSGRGRGARRKTEISPGPSGLVEVKTVVTTYVQPSQIAEREHGTNRERRGRSKTQERSRHGQSNGGKTQDYFTMNKAAVERNKTATKKQDDYTVMAPGGHGTVNCYRCGDSSHKANACKHIHSECFHCGTMGHLQNVCKKKTKIEEHSGCAPS